VTGQLVDVEPWQRLEVLGIYLELLLRFSIIFSLLRRNLLLVHILQRVEPIVRAKVPDQIVDCIGRNGTGTDNHLQQAKITQEELFERDTVDNVGHALEYLPLENPFLAPDLSDESLVDCHLLHDLRQDCSVLGDVQVVATFEAAVKWSVLGEVGHN